MTLVGHTILITGGATGIGFALAKRLQAENTVIICGRREHALQAAKAALPGLVARRCDIADDIDRSALVDGLHREFPSLNLLINNAGIQRRIDFASGRFDVAMVETEIATNLTAPVLLSAALIPQLSRQPEAMIVNISSGLAFCPLADVPVYCATKAAMHSFTLSLRHQLRHTSIRVAELVPPIVDTELDASGARHPNEGPPMMSADEFAMQALMALSEGDDEVAVGIAQGLRSEREALFAAINP